jgi:hypothetical protein
LSAEVCSMCGTAAGGEELPPGWSMATSERGIQWLCLDCTRRNVRSIEAKLPEEWW